MNIDLVMAYAGNAVYWAAILCGLFALIRVLISDKHRTIPSLLFFIPTIIYFVCMFSLSGINVLEFKGDFLSNRDVWRPASLFFVMALANILQFVVLVLGAVLILQKRVNRVNTVLFSVTTVLVLFLSILNYVYFYWVYPVNISIVPGPCNLIFLFVLYYLHRDGFIPRLKKWIPPIFLCVALIYALLTTDWQRFFTVKPFLIAIFYYSPLTLPIYLTVLNYVNERREKKRQALPA